MLGAPPTTWPIPRTVASADVIESASGDAESHQGESFARQTLLNDLVHQGRSPPLSAKMPEPASPPSLLRSPAALTLTAIRNVRALRR